MKLPHTTDEAIGHALGPLDNLESDIVFHVVEGAIMAAHNLINDKRRAALAAAGVELDEETASDVAGAINAEVRAFIAATVEDLDDELIDDPPSIETAEELLNRAIRDSRYGPALTALHSDNNPSADRAGIHGLSICFLMDRALKIAGVSHRYRELLKAEGHE